MAQQIMTLRGNSIVGAVRPDKKGKYVIDFSVNIIKLSVVKSTDFYNIKSLSHSARGTLLLRHVVFVEFCDQSNPLALSGFSIRYPDGETVTYMLFSKKAPNGKAVFVSSRLLNLLSKKSPAQFPRFCFPKAFPEYNTQGDYCVGTNAPSSQKHYDNYSDNRYFYRYILLSEPIMYNNLTA